MGDKKSDGQDPVTQFFNYILKDIEDLTGEFLELFGLKKKEMKVPKKPLCTSCGKENPPGNRFCNNCGEKI